MEALLVTTQAICRLFSKLEISCYHPLKGIFSSMHFVCDVILFYITNLANQM